MAAQYVVPHTILRTSVRIQGQQTELIYFKRHLSESEPFCVLAFQLYDTLHANSTIAKASSNAFRERLKRRLGSKYNVIKSTDEELRKLLQLKLVKPSAANMHAIVEVRYSLGSTKMQHVCALPCITATIRGSFVQVGAFIDHFAHPDACTAADLHTLKALVDPRITSATAAALHIQPTMAAATVHNMPATNYQGVNHKRYGLAVKRMNTVLKVREA